MTRPASGPETPREELARVTAEGYAELAELAGAPGTPEHMRDNLRAIASDLGAAGARADIATAADERELGLGEG